MVKVSQKSQKNKWKSRAQDALHGRPDRPRLSVSRSSESVYVQVVDDEAGKTLVAFSAKGLKGTKSEKSFEVGRRLAERLLGLGIKCVVFDRRGRRFHGRVKAVADGARQGGLEF